MAEYGNLSDQERRKLYQDFSRAAKEIRVDGVSRPDQRGGAQAGREEPGSPAGEIPREEAERFLFQGLRRKRPSYATRLRIESYAYSQGFEISGIGPFFTSLFSFLWPRRDPVPGSFLRSLVLDSPRRGDPQGYSLVRTLLELQKQSERLLGGGGYLRRTSDSSYNLKGDLTRDLLNWEPAGYRLLAGFQKIPPRLLEALEAVRVRVEQQESVDVFELADTVKGVYRITLAVQADTAVVEQRIAAAGELIKGLYKRIYTNEEKVQQVCTRIDHQSADFLACYLRLKWFAGQLYPALLKMMNVFRPQGEVASILGEIYAFMGMNPKDILVLRSSRGADARYSGGRTPGKPRTRAPADRERQQDPGQVDEEAVQEEGLEQEPEKAFHLNEEFRGILTILDYAFPGCRARLIGEGDYSILLWFHHRIFSHREYRGALVSRRPDLTDLLWKVGRRDPLAAVIVLHEIIGQMLESLNPDALEGMIDPLRDRSGPKSASFTEIRRHWWAVREELLFRYLKEIDYFEKELSLQASEAENRFLSSPTARKTIETINQIRNHTIRGYGHIALNMDRKEYFRCRPLYTLAGQLCTFLSDRLVSREELKADNPVVSRRYNREGLVELQSGPLMKQIHSYIDALPDSRRILDNPVAEYNRSFLEILFGFCELLEFLLSDPKSPLREAGAEVFVASAEERRIQNEIANDRSPLRVEMNRDFEEVDRLTGLFSKNEYLRFMPGLFQECLRDEAPLSVIVMDLDRFKAINDTRGHDFGDQILKAAAEVILSSGREEDPAVRFGGDELLVVVRGDAAAALGQAERIRKRYVALLKERFAGQLEEVPLLMAQKELAEKKSADPNYRGGIEDFLERWKGKGLGTLSIGLAQGLGKQLASPCADEKELFRRADKMLYLAKDSGGNRSVAMLDILEIPLTAQEYTDFVQYLEPIPRAERVQAARRFVDLRLANDKTPLFWNYPYGKYLEDA